MFTVSYFTVQIFIVLPTEDKLQTLLYPELILKYKEQFKWSTQLKINFVMLSENQKFPTLDITLLFSIYSSLSCKSITLYSYALCV